MTKTEQPKKKMSIGKKILIGFGGFIILVIILSKLFPIDYYEKGLDDYNKQNYSKAYEYLNHVESDDKNYTNAIAKIKEIKPIIDSLDLVAKQSKQTAALTKTPQPDGQTPIDNAAAEKTAKKNSEQEIKNNTITAKQLTAAYEANEVNADNNFKGKTLYVTGRIGEIKKDILDDIYVTLEGGEMFRQVQCYFEDKEIAGELHKGQKATFKGRCDGLMMNVIMKDCELVEVK